MLLIGNHDEKDSAKITGSDSSGRSFAGGVFKPLGVSQNKLARSLAVPVTRVHDLIHDRRAITPDTALRLSQYFGTTPEFWMNLQVRYDLEKVRRESGAAIAKSVRPLSQSA